METKNDVEEAAEKKTIDPDLRKMLIIFLVWCVITLPCAWLLGFRTQWLLWKLGF